MFIIGATLAHSGRLELLRRLRLELHELLALLLPLVGADIGSDDGGALHPPLPAPRRRT